ncbi:hypothetical protein F4778DRAFT_516957 [Xylariomycetidae sp. FL2044]|nr:hypothetical protein F4778DRAFT_516957 [Xylariomycetidae sp. FL2044]
MAGEHNASSRILIDILKDVARPGAVSMPLPPARGNRNSKGTSSRTIYRRTHTSSPSQMHMHEITSTGQASRPTKTLSDHQLTGPSKVADILDDYEFPVDGWGSSCLRYYPVMTASAVLHAFTDIWLIALVLPHIVRMRILPRGQKAGLACVLALGTFVACASLTRMAVAHRFLDPMYAQWDSLSFAIWTTLESSLGLICASVPMLRPLIRQLRGQTPDSRPQILRNVRRANIMERSMAVEQSPQMDGLALALRVGSIAAGETAVTPAAEGINLRELRRMSGEEGGDGRERPLVLITTPGEGDSDIRMNQSE